jgi:hypothetical protein
VAQIPSSAIAGALTEVSLTARDVEAARARRLQARKNQHQSEEVTELEEDAVPSVGEEEPQDNGQGGAKGKQKHLDVRAGGVEGEEESALDVEA